ncbi:MAG TPA: tetratricopeptide repeat protein [Vicinamibacterales bacterium]|nr:tetratricopeptide repeat protein [Vicinamibacterales bacterium]
MSDSLRIEELRRRVQKDPASIAFAQLAEEYRRAGQFEEAIAVARAGLAQHPAYLSARVTLGRALIEIGRLEEAAAEFEYVVRAAPDNLTAVRQLAEVHQRRRQSSNEAKSKQPATSSVDSPVVPVTPVVAVPHAPETSAPIGTDPPVRAEERAIVELEAWLAVLASERSARQSSRRRPR